VGFTGVFLLSNPFAKLILILISRDENHSKFNNFRSVGPKIVKQQTWMLPCQGLPLVPKVEQGAGALWLQRVTVSWGYLFVEL